MKVLKKDEAPEFAVPGFNFVGHTAPSRGAKEIVSWRVEVMPGAQGGTHKLSNEEVFHILAGELRFLANGEATAAGEGDSVIVPAGTYFKVSNASETEKALMIACMPVGTVATMEDGKVVGTPPWAQ